MRIMDAVKVMPTGVRRPDYLRPLVSYAVHELPESMDAHPDKDEYALKVEVGMKFACNRAEYEYALDNALRGLQHYLYSEQLELLHEIRALVFAGDHSALHEALGRLEGSMTKHR